MKKTWVVIIIITLAALVACSNGESDDIIEDLKTQITDLSGELAILHLENITLKEEVNEYRDKTIPEMDRALKEAEESLSKIQEESFGHDFQRLWFKKDNDTVLAYLTSSGVIPVYNGETNPYMQVHIELIKDWFKNFKDVKVQEIPEELMKWLYPVVYPLEITMTEVGFKSQYENAYYYNVVHYMTYGTVGDYNISKNIRAVGGVDDGFREVFIIEIYKEDDEWKIGYTGFGG